MQWHILQIHYLGHILANRTHKSRPSSNYFYIMFFLEAIVPVQLHRPGCYPFPPPRLLSLSTAPAVIPFHRPGCYPFPPPRLLSLSTAPAVIPFHRPGCYPFPPPRLLSLSTAPAVIPFHCPGCYPFPLLPIDSLLPQRVIIFCLSHILLSFLIFTLATIKSLP